MIGPLQASSGDDDERMSGDEVRIDSYLRLSIMRLLDMFLLLVIGVSIPFEALLIQVARYTTLCLGKAQISLYLYSPAKLQQSIMKTPT